MIANYLKAALICLCALGISNNSVAQTSGTPSENVVLVHGAWADGSDWQGVYDILVKDSFNVVKDGFNVSIVQEPETSFQEGVAATKRILALQDGPCILVVHSYGALVDNKTQQGPPRLWDDAARREENTVAACLSMDERPVAPREKLGDSLESLIAPGDRIVLEGDNQKQIELKFRGERLRNGGRSCNAITAFISKEHRELSQHSRVPASARSHW
jgi:hypothetical protein